MAPQSLGRSSHYSILAHYYFALCHSSQFIMICVISLLFLLSASPTRGLAPRGTSLFAVVALA